MEAVQSLVSEPEWRDRRRRRILAAAAESFAARPYHLVTMDDIAADAGLGKATLYRYFPSKDELYLAIFEQALATMLERLEAEAARPAAAAATLRRMIDALVPTFQEHLPSFRALSDAHLPVAERKRRLFLGHRHRIREAIAGVLAAGVADGSLRPLNPSLAAEMLVGMAWASVVSGVADDAKAIAEAIADMFLTGALTRTPHEEVRP